MKTFTRRTTVTCFCGTKTSVVIRGSVYESGKIKNVIRDAWECATCGRREPTTGLSAAAIQKVEEERSQEILL